MEIVRKIDWTPKWDGGTPMPQVFSNGHKVYLIYTVADWDKDSVRNVKTIGKSEENSELLALTEFDGYTFKFGIANDEVFPGLPLYKCGLDEWAHIIENSNWVEELKSIHKIHPSYNPFRWKQLNHYVLLFKDQLMEVIAKHYTIEVYKASYHDLSLEIIRRMNYLD
ncbi:hypothetical protein [Flavitalea sp.]|nr:hypothetical protein [Flavitalea sp.]